jgi:hypothetical protein
VGLQLLLQDLALDRLAWEQGVGLILDRAIARFKLLGQPILVPGHLLGGEQVLLIRQDPALALQALVVVGEDIQAPDTLIDIIGHIIGLLDLTPLLLLTGLLLRSLILPRLVKPMVSWIGWKTISPTSLKNYQ